MNKHTSIRNAVLDALTPHVGEKAALYDGLPAFIDAQDLPAVAVWLTDAQYTGDELDGDSWKAVLHVAVFLKAIEPDRELDRWMEETVYPAVSDANKLVSLIDTMNTLGFDYQRDSEMVTWAMAEMSWQITYTM
jgi:predicted  nucleic acid-binding Zn ribbon protein